MARLIDANVALNLYKPSNVPEERWAETTLAKAINGSPTVLVIPENPTNGGRNKGFVPKRKRKA